MKGTLAILNTVIKKGHQVPSYPNEFVDKWVSCEVFGIRDHQHCEKLTKRKIYRI